MIPLVTHPAYSYPFPNQHRFAMQKFRLLASYLQEKQLLTRENSFRPGQAKEALLSLAHCPHYLQRFASNQQTKKEQRQMGLPWSAGLKKRTFISPSGTLLAAHLAIKHGIACHLAGGTHHAHFDYASGFCILNDLAICARALIKFTDRKKVLIFDCDVHQGDGTAQILQTETQIFTCSIHAEKNFPFKKASSHLDVPLACGLTDEPYLAQVEQTLKQLIDQQQPDFIIYDAGVDVYEHDPLGRLNISIQGIEQRDRIVLQQCLLANIPVVSVIGGGYDNDEKALAKRHAIVTEQAFSLLS